MMSTVLAAIVDLYSRKVVAWAMQPTMHRSLVLKALDMAVVDRQPKAGLIHHSDRGSQYASDDYRNALKAYGMIASMSRRGCCYDNAIAESFWHTVKNELVFPRKHCKAARRLVKEDGSLPWRTGARGTKVLGFHPWPPVRSHRAAPRSMTGSWSTIGTRSSTWCPRSYVIAHYVMTHVTARR